MKLVGLDIETGTFVEDVKKALIIELGMVLWDVDRKQPIKMLSELVKEDGVAVSEEVTELTGIDMSMLREYGWQVKEYDEGDPIWCTIADMLCFCDGIVAHNGTNFDFPIFYAFCDRYCFGRSEVSISDKIHIDTMIDIKYPKSCSIRNLTYLGAFHGFLNPFPHRAVMDVLSMFSVLSNYNIEEVVEMANSPIIRLIADVTYDDREKAKKEMFLWNSSRKIWYKEIKEVLLPEMNFSFPFHTERVDED